MLTYEHIFNENLDYPFHIHIIDTNSTSVSISLNKLFIGQFKKTIGSTYTFSKHYQIPDIFSLIVVGSRQNYTNKINNAYFKESTSRYIKNTAGLYLNIDPDTKQYFWNANSRTKFYFNPEYFSSKFLWELTIGYMPIGTTVLDLFSDTSLFSNKVYETTEFWPGSKDIADVNPVTVDYFSLATIGVSKSFSVDYFINELQDLKDGDIIDITNGNDSLSIVVNNIYTKATYQAINTTTRPIIHVPIDIVNPNKKYVYSKDLAIGTSENINIQLHGNNIDFSIARI